jgi:hypothetical protein
LNPPSPIKPGEERLLLTNPKLPRCELISNPPKRLLLTDPKLLIVEHYPVGHTCE